MHKLIDYVCDKLEEIERKVDKGAELSMTEVQYADTLAHLKKNLLKAEEMSDGYSNRGYSRGDYRHIDGRGYARMHDGRYAPRYSMASDEVISELKGLMNNAPDEQTRREFQKFINKIETM